MSYSSYVRAPRALFAIALVAAALALPASAAAQAVPADFAQVLPSDVQWKPHPTVPGAEIAILLGVPAAEGPYAMRIRFPANTRVAPHTHPEARTYTVLTGEWKLGFGSRVDAKAFRVYPAGSLYRLPAQTPHFQESGAGVTIIQIQARGPTRTDLIPPSPD